MIWRLSTILRLTGIGCLVLGLFFPQRVFLVLGFGLLITGWILRFREGRRHPGGPQHGGPH